MANASRPKCRLQFWRGSSRRSPNGGCTFCGPRPPRKDTVIQRCRVAALHALPRCTRCAALPRIFRETLELLSHYYTEFSGIRDLSSADPDGILKCCSRGSQHQRYARNNAQIHAGGNANAGRRAAQQWNGCVFFLRADRTIQFSGPSVSDNTGIYKTPKSYYKATTCRSR